MRPIVVVLALGLSGCDQGNSSSSGSTAAGAPPALKAVDLTGNLFLDGGFAEDDIWKREHRSGFPDQAAFKRVGKAISWQRTGSNNKTGFMRVSQSRRVDVSLLS